MAKYKKMVIGIDQSYEDSGISIFIDNKKISINSLKSSAGYSNSKYRYFISGKLKAFLERKIGTADETIIIVERIRQFSGGFVSMDYIKSTGALIATIVDIAALFNIKVYSVDTRAWKKQIVGTSKPKNNKYGINPNKWPTIEFVKSKGWLKDVLIELPQNTKKKKGVLHINGKKFIINDNMCDSACIAMYGFLPKFKQNLKEEH